MKAMYLMLQCYNMRARLIGSGVFVKEFSDYRDKVKRDEETNTLREQEISRREQALQAYLERRNLTIDEFYNDPDKSDRIF